MLRVVLERDGFDVVAVAGVREALGRIVAENFDVLLSALHMPHAGDGFTVGRRGPGRSSSIRSGGEVFLVQYFFRFGHEF